MGGNNERRKERKIEIEMEMEKKKVGWAKIDGLGSVELIE